MAGFPLSLDLQCGGAKFADQAMSADLGHIAVTAPLYRPGHFEASLTAPLVFNAPDLGLAVTASWSGARAFLVGGGAVYLVLWLYGLLIDQDSNANFVPLDDADNWLHLALGLGMVALGIGLGRDVDTRRAR